MFVIPVFLLAVSLSISLAKISRTKSSERARISDRASDRARWAEIRGWMLLVGAGLCIALVAMLSGSAHAGVALEARKLPMKFTWVDCQPNCRGWVSAAGIVTADSPRDFDEFARGRQLGGATIVLDSSGGSVNASIALGRRFRELGALTTVGISVQTRTAPERSCQHGAGGVLRIDVRVPSPVGHDTLRARDCPCPGASDLARRPRQ
jgi:hypothetical protein